MACITVERNVDRIDSRLRFPSAAAGSRHHMAGVAPLSLFLQVLGVRLISPHEIALLGFNPFLNPGRLRRRRLEINWEGESALVQFPDGSSTQIKGEGIWVVEQGGDGSMRQSAA